MAGYYKLENTTGYQAESPALTITNGAAVFLTAAKYNPTTGLPATFVTISVETASIRYFVIPNATIAVTTTLGHLLTAGDVLVIEGMENIKNFQCIAVAGNATIQVSYERG
jgi:hypothetical protein